VLPWADIERINPRPVLDAAKPIAGAEVIDLIAPPSRLQSA